MVIVGIVLHLTRCWLGLLSEWQGVVRVVYGLRVVAAVELI